MKILMVCAEFAPLAKTGGLADAVAGLSAALAERGHDVRVLLPHYAHLPPADTPTTPVDAPAAGHRYTEVRDPTNQRPRVYLFDSPGPLGGPRPLEGPGLFDDDAIYTGDDRDAARFLALCEAALAFPTSVRWQPDIMHCHDWHAAMLPAMLRAAHAGTDAGGAPRAILSLHNVGYQGVFGEHVLAGGGRAGLRSLLAANDITGGDINFLRTGIRHADLLTTVSPTYAREIRTAEQGMGLEDLLSTRAGDLHGILNGVDYRLWGPESDPFIEPRYSAADTAPKRIVKRALCEQLGLADRALIGVVSRLTPQKGIDLLAAALPALLRDTDAAFALLGAGDPVLAGQLRTAAAAQPRRISFTEGYDEALAHRIFAGSDLLAIPSRYEPCGLTQLYALRYGTIPVVRRTGGLADTVEHFDPESGRGNGAVFGPADSGALVEAMRAALEWFAQPASWSRLVANAMRADFSWQNQVGEYEALYQTLAR